MHKYQRRGILLTGLCIVIGFAGCPWTPENNTVLVPNVLNTQQAEAEAALAAAGLQVGAVVAEFHTTAAEGLVTGQYPEAGIAVESGNPVSLVISKGIAQMQTSDVEGLSLLDAYGQLLSQGFQITVDQVYDPVTPKDRVREQDPPGGAIVALGAAIRLVVSKGPEPLNEVDMLVTRWFPNGAVYASGDLVEVTLSLQYVGEAVVNTLSFSESLPAGWRFEEVLDGPAPDAQAFDPETGLLALDWQTIPEFPLRLTYSALAPTAKAGTVVFSGFCRYEATGPGQASNLLESKVTPVGSMLEMDLEVRRSFSTGTFYLPGEPVVVDVALMQGMEKKENFFAFQERIPLGWRLESLMGDLEGGRYSYDEGTGILEIAAPRIKAANFPFRYTVVPPAGLEEEVVFSGEGFCQPEGLEAHYALTLFSTLTPGPGLEGEIPLEGELPLEGEVAPEMILQRSFPEGSIYTPGESVEVKIQITYTGSETIMALGLEELLPPGWTVDTLVEGDLPSIFLFNEITNSFTMAWVTVPEFPVRFIYRITAPATASGDATLSGSALYRTTGDEMYTNEVVSLLEEAP